ncbi:MAG: AraC family transcriptional regulator [Verrucomicrobiales bacterium]
MVLTGDKVPAIDVPIERIVLIDEVTRQEALPFQSTSTPQHLIHVTLSGEVKQSAAGQIEHFRGGDVIWYHEAEPVKGEILRAPWRFITIGFTAPGLSPPAADRRVLPCGTKTIPLAQQLLQIWRDETQAPVERALLCTGRLVELLLDFAPVSDLVEHDRNSSAGGREHWWQVENALRLHLDAKISLSEIADLAGISKRSTNRNCKAATGMAPVQRLRELRMNHARGLLQHTDLPITEVAYRVGYTRVQEFSRDFKKRYRQTPREARKAEPDYREL